ncbi:AraC family transcriptional regulator [Leifsonia poae]|uniref:AraC family transcriptional regulator n=1 Tax=Leifsonia poae TaxID=110933 RepID=UPI001CBF4BEF|nr:AraC family transcriptional regulator [Leifsonia poae]
MASDTHFFTPRLPARAELSGRRAIEFFAWHSTIRVDDVERFHAEIDVVVYDAMAITWLRQSEALVARSAEQVASLLVGTSYLFLRSGRMVVRQRGREIVLEAGDVALVSGLDPYEFENAEPVVLLIIVTRRGALAPVGVPGLEPDLRVVRPGVFRDAVVAFVSTIAREFSRPGSVEGVMTQRIVSQMLGAMVLGSIGDEQPDENSAAMRSGRALQYIGVNAKRADLTGAHIAAAQGISTRQLQRVLADAGTTVARELRDHRLREAVALLTSPEWRSLSLDEVGAASGFGTQARMRRAFQAAFGRPPGAVRADPPTEPGTALTRFADSR